MKQWVSLPKSSLVMDLVRGEDISSCLTRRGNPWGALDRQLCRMSGGQHGWAPSPPQRNRKNLEFQPEPTKSIYRKIISQVSNLMFIPWNLSLFLNFPFYTFLSSKKCIHMCDVNFPRYECISFLKAEYIWIWVWLAIMQAGKSVETWNLGIFPHNNHFYRRSNIISVGLIKSWAILCICNQTQCCKILCNLMKTIPTKPFNKAL